ncbi:MAG TPA: DNA helicase RecQ [Anaerolineales bacterium]|nr:DNA helicase RecQ [Anaerolineales bacterium]HNN14997.1 DNA helicase RecQ [Anaerolineales bacterium]HNO30195.1 DNA helicase RecQ [Anaerolineales bacterium]
MQNPASILKNTFGYDTFRPLQQQVIDNVLARRDTLAVMPTGGGKSLCYQIPSLILEGLTVVVSPLISLMKDQVEQLRAFGVPAVFLNSSLSAQAYQENMDYVKRGEVKLLYVAPETLLTPRILSLLSALKVDLLTIDEAHCISEWGHDFRPEYRQIAEVRERFPNAVCMALTATATSRVRQDIRQTLKFSTTNEFFASFNRENLYIEVLRKEEPTRQTLKLLDRHKDQSGIIYCFSRRQVDDLSADLVARGYSARPYHAGLEDAERHRNQEAFIRDDVQIIVATIAFGMGINKPNVRFVIHYDLPKSIEGYYQEIGRAGRDGLPAYCTLLYSYSDVAKINYFINKMEGDVKRSAMQHLDAIVRYAEDERNCRRKPLLNYFGESTSAETCSNCDNCTSAPAVLKEITVPAQKFLSCVKRADEKFGAGHIADILLGSKNEKVLRWEHDKLSTYGIGTELDKKQWMHLARQLVQMGYLTQEGEFHTLCLTAKALEALRKREPIFGVVQEAVERVKKDGRKNVGELDYHRGLFSILRQKRKEMADEAGVPPYVIFSDRTLIEMAAYFPQTPASLLTISGVGQVKARQYGEAFLEVLKDYSQRHGLTEKPKEVAVPREKSDSNRRYVQVGEAYNSGDTVAVLMERYRVSAGTILEHLTRYLSAGNSLRRDGSLDSLTAVSPTERKAAFAAFDEVGTAFLKPVFDKLEGRLNYDDLKILRLLYLVSGGS